MVISVSDKLIYGRTSNDRYQPDDLIVTIPEGKSIIIGKDNIRNCHFDIINNNLDQRKTKNQQIQKNDIQNEINEGINEYFEDV